MVSDKNGRTLIGFFASGKRVIHRRFFLWLMLAVVASCVACITFAGCRKKQDSAAGTPPAVEFPSPTSRPPSAVDDPLLSVSPLLSQGESTADSKDTAPAALAPSADSRESDGEVQANASGSATGEEAIPPLSEPAPPEPRICRIVIQVVPTDAEVRVDDRAYTLQSGQAEIQLADMQQAEIVISREGWRTFRQNTTISDTNVMKLIISLQPDAEWWLVRAQHDWAADRIIDALSSLAVVDLSQPKDATRHSALALKVQVLLKLDRPDLAWQQLERLQSLPGVNLDDYQSLKRPVLLAMANRSLGLGEFAAAIDRFSELIASGDANATLFYQRGIALWGAGERLAALADFEQSILLDPRLHETLTPRMQAMRLDAAVELVRQSNGAAAMVPLNTLLSEDPQVVPALILRASLHNQAGRYAAAATDCQTALHEQPGNLQAHQEWASSLVGAREFAAALQPLGTVLANQPDRADMLRQRGYCLLNLRQLEPCLEDLSRAVSLQPDSRDAWFYRGMAFLESGQSQKAWQDFRRCLDLNGGDDTLARFYCGVALENMQDWQAALQEYTAVLDAEPDLIPARLNRCVLLTDTGRVEQAIEDASAVLRLDPNHAVAFNNRGVALTASGAVEEANGDFSKAIELMPEYAEAWFNRATNRFREGAYELAIDDFTRALACEPDSREIQVGRAKAFMQIGNYQQARFDLLRVLRDHPKHAEALELIGLIKPGDDEPGD